MPRRVIPADPASAFPELGQLFGGWFHEDWPYDYAGWEAVVDDFVTESSPVTVRACRAEIRTLIAAGLDSEDLEEMLEALGADVSPAAFDLTAGEWLDAVRARLGSPGAPLR